MLDIQSLNESLKMKWIQGYLNEENKGKWKLFFDHYLVLLPKATSWANVIYLTLNIHR